ncbi:MAG TPA: alkylmercury lyase family protein [Cyclobacteriaceae bacterium]|nr:alkylmercury lyase family protein [Cyclobacteriaceae bacterium]
MLYSLGVNNVGFSKSQDLFMASTQFQNTLRYHVSQFIFDHGFAPNALQLANRLNCQADEILAGLDELARNNAIVLHPNSHDIWVAHPFALFPTLFWVRAEGKQWWCNCAWCALGLAALCKGAVDIHTKLGGEEHPIKIEIRNGKIVQDQYVVHLATPASKLWSNVIYTCSMALIFENEFEINKWCIRHNKPKGEAVKINKVSELAKAWYGNHLSPEFQVKTKDVATGIFRQVGLTSKHWQL